jgi:hypothetical protein
VLCASVKNKKIYLLYEVFYDKKEERKDTLSVESKV